MSRKALVLCHADPASDPRPYRAIQWLQRIGYEVVCATSTDEIGDEGIEHVKLAALPRRLRPRYFVPVSLFWKLFGKQYRVTDEAVARDFKRICAERNFELVICFDLDLLIWPVSSDCSAKLIFDAREFYPRQFEDRVLWRMVFGYLADQQCRQLLKYVDLATTVSPGLKAAYQQDYGLETSVLLSLPDPIDLSPRQLECDDRIRLIYHGNANPSRSIERMIEMVHLLDTRFEMDFMLVSKDKKYLDELRKLVGESERIRFISPQKMTEIVPFISTYDIGVFLVPPKNFNLKHCLPNKLFEYIQARLAVAIGPSPDMREVVEAGKVGLVSDSFEPKSLAGKLNSLSVADINAMKMASHQLAMSLHSEQNFLTFSRLITEDK